ncbi:hypothetical protein C6Q09_17675 [Burkholderia multivorans]|uniref:Uncharacterized protein n=1 Tax=Burkholderia multivorans TaxID=87883 RepID=A0A8E2RRG1_9BURK|nr:hypothetical protein C6P76_03730 [Burkholderia multivorans]PRE09937.1 hypothetical protein C6P92_24480 [Burkholderia multivorans]PRE63586.1 hypothetical protein C6P86_18565 [Burkholderia multivorans]PRE91441.1 hypothetical protein C6Q00_01005 [Burkholderia multivorans]PRF17288.1 hypothetical protein C6Q03_28310 [Burkholderia multivorans]
MLPAVSRDSAADARNAGQTASLFRRTREFRRISLLKPRFLPLSAPAMCGTFGHTAGGCRFGFNL